MFDDVTTVLCDLDGVVWLAHQPIPGSVAAIAAIRSAGRRVLFVTNNSGSTIAQHEAALAAIGIGASGDVVSSAMSAAAMVEVGERVLITAGPGVVDAIRARGAAAVSNTGSDADLDDPISAVVVGMHRDFDYQRLRVAAKAVRAGARLIGTNSDATYPTPHGLEPGGGSILAAVATACGVLPLIAGKPEQPMVEMIREFVSTPDRSFDPSTTVMIGDRMDTDGLFAQRIGCRFVLVETGVSSAGSPIDSGVTVAQRAPDLAAFAAGLDH